MQRLRCSFVSLSIGFRADYTLFRERRLLQGITHKGIRYPPFRAFSCKLSPLLLVYDYHVSYCLPQFLYYATNANKGNAAMILPHKYILCMILQELSVGDVFFGKDDFMILIFPESSE